MAGAACALSPSRNCSAGMAMDSVRAGFDEITALVITFRRKRYLPVGWFWFLGTLIPVIGLVQVGEAAMADRYAYIPLIGIFVMIAWGLADLAEAKAVRTVWRVIPAMCVLIALGFVTHRQMSYWESEYTLWAHTLAVTDPSGIPMCMTPWGLRS